MKNEQLVPASAFVVMLMGTVASVERSQSLPGINFWLGLAIAFLFISLVEEVDPTIGGGLSVLVMVSAMLGYGEDVMKFTSARTGGKIGGPPPKQQRTRGTITVPQERLT